MLLWYYSTAVMAYPILGSELNFREALSLLPVILGAVLVCVGEVCSTYYYLYDAWGDPGYMETPLINLFLSCPLLHLNPYLQT